MAYNINLTDKVRAYLVENTDLSIEEKEMFGVLNFLVNGKTCICVSGERLMLRFDPRLQEEIAENIGYETMLMKGKQYKGYCYINPEGFEVKQHFEYYLNICLDYNKASKASSKSRQNKIRSKISKRKNN